MSHLTMKIDWLEMTGKDTKEKHLRSYAQAQEWLVGYAKKNSLSSRVWFDAAKSRSAGYRYEFLDGNDGSVWSIGENLGVQGFKVTYTGRTMPTREVSIARTQEYLEQRLKPVRIDYAFDVVGSASDVDAIASAVALDNCDVLQSVRYIQSKSGSTLYIGSPKAKVQLRIYDKGAQTGAPEKRWLRYELQTRQEASVAFVATPGYGFAAAASKILAMVGGHAKEFEALTESLRDDGEVPHYTSPRSPSRYYKWFWSQVLPAAMKWMNAEPVEAADFMTALNMHWSLSVDERVKGDYDTEAD